MKIAFDVDNTLIVQGEGGREIPNYKVIDVYRFFQDQGHHMIVWSGSGLDWAITWAEKLGLRPNEIRIKQKADDVDLAFDDMEVTLGRLNIQVL